MQEAEKHPFSLVESALISLLGSAVFGAQLPEKIEADIDLVLKEAENLDDQAGEVFQEKES